MSNDQTPTTVAIIGGHGQIALLTAARLIAAGHRVLSVVRNADHVADLTALGAEPVVVDLEAVTGEELAAELPGASVLVFAAGAGAGSGPERKETVDHQGAVTTFEAARILSARVVQISFQKVDAPVDTSKDETWQAYHRAKKAADDELIASGVDFTILRPGILTDEPAGGVTVGADLPSSTTSRDSVAAVLVAVIEAPFTAGSVLDVIDGDTPPEHSFE